MLGVLSTFSKESARRVFGTEGLFRLTLDWVLSNAAHGVESILDSIWFKFMCEMGISRHDTCIAVQKYC